MRLAYWVKAGFKALAVIVGACALYGFIMWIQMGMEFLEFLGITAPLMIIFFGAIMLFAYGMMQYRMALNLSLSFGSTRREAMVGLHLYRLIPILAIPALAVLLPLLFGQELLFGLRATILVGVGVMFLGGAMGMITGMIDLRLGKVVSIIISILVGLGCGVCAAFIGIASDEGIPFVSDLPASGILALAGAVVYLLVSIFEARTVRRYQVK